MPSPKQTNASCQTNKGLAKLQIILQKIFPWLISAYFFLIFFSLISANLPFIGKFIISGTGKMLYRSFLAISISLYALLLAIANFRKINWIIGAITITCTCSILLGYVSNGQSFSYSYYTEYYNWLSVTSYFSWNSALSGFVDRAFGSIFAFSLFFILPFGVGSKKDFYPMLWCCLGLCFICSVYSYIKEMKLYLKFWNVNSYSTDIHSLFSTKNGFGQFLFQGVISSLLLTFLTKKKWWLIPLPFLFLTILFTLCKTALFSSIFLGLGFLVYFIFSIMRTHPKISSSLLISLIVVFIAFLLFMFIPPFHQSGFSKQIFDFIYKSIFETGDNTTAGRGEVIWTYISHADGWRILFGSSTFTGSYLQYWEKDWGVQYSLHNAYASTYAIGGILLLGIYVFYQVFAFINIFRNIKKLPLYMTLVLVVLVSFIFYGMTEDVKTFFTASGNNFLMNIMTSTFLMYIIKDREEGNDHEKQIQKMA